MKKFSLIIFAGMVLVLSNIFGMDMVESERFKLPVISWKECPYGKYLDHTAYLNYCISRSFPSEFLNVVDENGQTPLHIFCSNMQECNFNLLKNYLKYGANPNVKDKDGNTPMMVLLDFVCVNPYYDKMKALGVLLKYGADLMVINNKGSNILHKIVFLGDLKIFKFLLLQLNDDQKRFLLSVKHTFYEQPISLLEYAQCLNSKFEDVCWSRICQLLKTEELRLGLFKP